MEQVRAMREDLGPYRFLPGSSEQQLATRPGTPLRRAIRPLGADAYGPRETCKVSF